jgi:hypothetical protein
MRLVGAIWKRKEDVRRLAPATTTVMLTSDSQTAVIDAPDAANDRGPRAARR